MRTGSGSQNVPPSSGCVSQGSTRDEALANIREAIELCLEVRAERSLPLTIETRQTEVTATEQKISQAPPGENLGQPRPCFDKKIIRAKGGIRSNF